MAEVKVESNEQVTMASSVATTTNPAPPDDSKLSPVQKILRVQLWSDDRNVVGAGLEELADLCFEPTTDFKENQVAVGKAMGAPVIVGAMRKWHDDPEIQAEGCRALCKASLTSSDNSVLKSAKETGALDSILSALKNHPQDAYVQSCGYSALVHLARLKVNAVHAVKELKCLDLVVKGMNEFPDDATLQRRACYALHHLSHWNELKELIVQAGARQALLNAIEIHKDESLGAHVKVIQQYGRAALKQLL